MGEGYNSQRQQLEVGCVMKYAYQKVPYITMEELTKLQKEWEFFDNLMKKASSSTVIDNCKEKMKPLEMTFDAIDQGKVLIADYD